MTSENAVTLRTIFENTGLYETPDAKVSPITKVGSEVQFDVLDINLGDNYEFCKVKLSPENSSNLVFQADSSKEYYIRSYFLSAREDDNDSLDLLLSLTKDQAEEKYNTEEIKIKDAKIGMPYKENGKYNIVVDTHHTLQSEVFSKLNLIKFTALDTLLEYFGKNVDNIPLATKQSFVNNPFNLMQHSEPYLPTRPNQNIRIKLSISEKYFQVFEEMNFETFSIDNIHKNFIACNIKVNEIEGAVDSLAKILDGYDNQVSRFSGEVEGLNFKKMSNDIRKFLSDFKIYLSENDVVVSASDNNKLELGFDKESLSLGYVLYYDPFGKFLKIGMNMFCKLIDIRIAKILINYRDILSSLQSGMGWMDFCKNYFNGEYKINFAKLSQIGSVAKKSLTQLQDDLQAAKSDFEDMSLMIPKDVSGLDTLKKDEKFRETASELLMRSKDVIGDNFLINLPEILANVQDLNSLYTLVFDKVSIKDLTDLMLENIGEKMNVPDLNEIKIRGVLKAINSEDIPDIITSAISSGIISIEELVESFCDGYDFSKQQYLKFIETLEEVLAQSQADLADLIIHINSDGELDGYLPKSYEDEQALIQSEILSEPDIASQDENGVWKIFKDYISFKDLFRQSFANNLIKQIFSTGTDEFHTVDGIIGGQPKTDFVVVALDFFKNIDKSQLSKALDNLIKNKFFDAKKHQEAQKQASVDYDGTTNATQSPYYDPNQFETPAEFMKKLLSIPKIKIELDKLNLTKKKLLKKAPGLDLDLEIKKLDANFKFPSIQDINPSFDFSKFEFENTGDIFGFAVEAIEKSIISGIESGLVASFKSMLQRVLESLNKDSPDIDKPNYGGLNMNDILDATSGFGAEMMAKLASIKIEGSLERAKKKDKQFCKDLEDLVDIELPSLESIKGMFDDISLSLKPMELTRILKGQVNSRDYDNVSSAVQNPDLKVILTKDLFLEIIGIATDYVDMRLLEELEHAYTQEEVMISVCEDAGIPYNRRDIKIDLSNKYTDLSDEEVDELIDSIVDDVKDSMIGAIGNLKENFQDNLPFDEDPCSFMPKPSDIPPMDYIDDMAFNSIFDPIEIEYKAEATVIPDLLMSANQSDSYVQLYYYAYDQIIDPAQVGTDSFTGMPTIGFIMASESDSWDNAEGRIYNEEFANHYVGRSTKLYNLKGGEFYEITDSTEIQDIGITQNVKGEWEANTDKQVYVRKLDQELTPLPELKNWLFRPKFGIAQKKQNGERMMRLSLKIDDHTSVSESDYRLEFSNGKYEYVSLLPDLALVDVECGESSTVSNDNGSEKSIIDNVEDAIISAYEKSGINSVLPGSYSTVRRYAEFQGNAYTTYGSTFSSIFFNDTVNADQKHRAYNRSFPVRIVGAIFEQLGRIISKTKLFNNSDMLAFVIDDEDINLLKLQDAKNSAKDEYKAECSFTEDDDKLEMSSIKRLIYLTIRIFVIEEVAKGCFMYDKFYNLEADDEYSATIFSSVISEISQYSEGYYESVFRPQYKKAFGDSLPASIEGNMPPSFGAMVKEVYEDVSRNFDQLFRKAEKSVYAAFLKNCVWDMETPNGGTEEDIPHLIAQSYGKYMQPDRDLYAASTQDKEKIRSRFVIQRTVQKRSDYTAGRIQIEEPYEKVRQEQIGKLMNEAYDLVTKICYVYKIEYAADGVYVVSSGGELPEEGPNPGLYFFKDRQNDPGFFKTFLYGTENIQSSHGITWNRFASMTNDVSYEVALNYGSSEEEQYMILPLAIMRENVSVDLIETYQSKELLLDHLVSSNNFSTNEGDTIIDFLKSKVYLSAMKEFLASSMQARMLTIKPEIALMFRETKTAIRKAIESLAQDAYDYEERDTRTTQLEQSSEVSTSPEFSSKAAKMALMTVPMIIKGFAEMFDNNIQLASAIRKTFGKSGVDIPPAAASLLALPANVIPLAPGPPITPLGLLYLATNFLEPKERKKLANLKRGKNLNPNADPETGSFEGGSIEEQAAAATADAIELAKEAREKYERIANFIIEFYKHMPEIRNTVYDSAYVKGKIYYPYAASLYNTQKPPIQDTGLVQYTVLYGDCTFTGLDAPAKFINIDGRLDEDDVDYWELACKNHADDGLPKSAFGATWRNLVGTYNPYGDTVIPPLEANSTNPQQIGDANLARMLGLCHNQAAADCDTFGEYNTSQTSTTSAGFLSSINQFLEEGKGTNALGAPYTATNEFQPDEDSQWSVELAFFASNHMDQGKKMRGAANEVYKALFRTFAMRLYMVYFLVETLEIPYQYSYFSDKIPEMFPENIEGTIWSPTTFEADDVDTLFEFVKNRADSSFDQHYSFMPNSSASLSSGTVRRDRYVRCLEMATKHRKMTFVDTGGLYYRIFNPYHFKNQNDEQYLGESEIDTYIEELQSLRDVYLPGVDQLDRLEEE